MTSRVWGKRYLLADLSDGLCVGHPDPDIWFDPARSVEARRVCAECPVAHACHLTALSAKEQHGVWGGADAHERGTPPTSRY